MGRAFKGAGFPSAGEMEGLHMYQEAYERLGRAVGPHCQQAGMHPTGVERATPVLKSVLSKRQSSALAG